MTGEREFPPFILASASPRRLALLAQVGLTPVQVVAADIDESIHPRELPRAYVARVARQKAKTVAARHPGHTILAADTAVVMGRRVLPKAETAAEARDCLVRLSGRRHQVLTHVCVLRGDGTIRQKTVMTVVQFARLSGAQIDAYLASDEWRGKAGGYAIQGAAEAFIPFIRGAYSNVVGLPLAATLTLLR